MAEGWHKSPKLGRCSQCDEPCDMYHLIEFSYREAGMPLVGQAIVFRCPKHTVRPYESAHVCSHSTHCPNARIPDED